MRRITLVIVLGIVALGIALAPRHLVSRTATNPDFVHFESPHVHPACLTPSGDRLLVVNTPDNRLTVFDLTQGMPSQFNRIAEIPVGLEPVTVCALSDSEAWVVNRISDDVSIVNLNTLHVKATLRVGDEPADLVFAGTPTRAYVSVMQEDAVKVYDAATRAPVTTIHIDGRMPRSLAKTADGSKVYVAVFHSGNLTSIMGPSKVPDDSIPQDPFFPKDTLNGPAPKTGLIVQYQAPGGPAGKGWYDIYGNLWSSKLKYTMKDVDLAEITTASNTVTRTFGGSADLLSHIGSTGFAIDVNPVDNRIGLANTNARNLFRFEPGVLGYLVETQISWVTQAGQVFNRKLDPHINYNVVPGTQAEADSAIGIPTGMAFSGDGLRAYVTSMATNKIAVANPAGGPLSTIKARVGTLSGPTGVVVDNVRKRLYVVGRFLNQLQTLSTDSLRVRATTSIGMDPTPDAIVNGRRVFYAGFGSTHGDQSCASCHIFADTDHMGWDLGNPAGAYAAPPPGQPDTLLAGSHPMKGPMMTQSLRGLPNTGLLHWRGDRANITAFNAAFVSLMGRTSQLPDSQMAAPNQNLDRTFPDAPVGEPSALRGQTLFDTVSPQACSSCHTAASFAPGTNTNLVHAAALLENQDLKVPQLRMTYVKTEFKDSAGVANVSGFGFTHDGSVDQLMNHLRSPRFSFVNGDSDRQDIAAYLRAFDTGLAPSVGYQITFDGANNANAGLNATLDTLISQADAGNCDLVAHGRYGGQERGYLYSGGTWQADKAADPPRSRVQMLQLAELGTELTVTGVPPGTGTRMALDRDRDGYDDGDELDARSDPGNPESTPLNVGVLPGPKPVEGLRRVGPNPSHGAVVVEFALGRGGPVDLSVYDVLGREVRRIAHGALLTAGVQRLSWDGRDTRGGRSGAGVYFVRLKTATGSWTRPVVMIQ